MRCPNCKQPVTHPLDVFEHYCPNCHTWFSDRILHHYGMDGNRISMREWAETLNDADRHIADTYLEADGEQVRVSTVYMGINMQFGEGAPLLFETMIFGGRFDQYQWRYPTKHAALAGHDQALALVQDTASAPHDKYEQ